MSNSHAEDTVHSGPIKNPKQLLYTVGAAFIIPIFIIIGLVLFVTTAFKPSGSNQASVMSLGGISEQGRERAQAMRLQKVGMVEIRDANRPLKGGEDVFKAQCSACHAAGVAGAPKFGDKEAWAPRIPHGYETLLHSALKGKGAMGPQGGGDFSDVEIGRAVVYMTNAAGGNLPEPQAEAAGTQAAAGDAAQAATTPSMPVAAAATAAQPKNDMAATPQPAAADSAAGEALYKSACFVCHAAGVANAPKFGDKAAWAPRIATGIDTLVAAAIKGMGAMPPRGGSAASDADIHAAVEYMVNAAK